MRFERIYRLLLIAVMACAMLGVGCQPTPEPNDEPKDETKPFAFERITPQHTTLNIDIIPEDKQSEYILFVAQKEHFVRNGIDTREELLEDDYLYFAELAESYELGLHDFLSAAGWLVKGDKLQYGAINLFPDTEYVVYCYGVVFDGDYYEATTEICYEVVTTTAPEIIEVPFSIECEVEGNLVTVNIDTNGYKGYYYHYVVSESDPYYLNEGDAISHDFISHYRNMAFTEFNKLINDLGTPISDFCTMGDSTFTQRYSPNTGYMVVTFAVSKEQTPLLCSTPSLGYFRTAETLESDLKFEIEVSDITPYKAQLSITPTNDDTYACIFVAASQLPPLDDEQVAMETIIEYYQPAILQGKYSEPLLPLNPESEYAVAIFGCDEGVPTTKLYIHRFTTPKATKGTTTIDGFEVLEVYDVDEIVALDASFAEIFADYECVAIATVKTTPSCDKVYWWWYEDWMLEEYGEDAFLEDLLMYDPTPTTEIFGLWYELPILFAGIAEDENGNLSDIFYGDIFTLTKGMCSPAEEFLAQVEIQAKLHSLNAR